MNFRFLPPCLPGMALALALPLPSHALVASLTGGPNQLYLQVGDGSFIGGDYKREGTAARNPKQNTVSVAVKPEQLGNGSPQAMISDSLTEYSLYDSFKICTAPTQVYVGAWWRSDAPDKDKVNATLSINPESSLSSGADIMPFSQIYWESSAAIDPTPHIPAGDFSTSRSITIGYNQWFENCHSFHYRNSRLLPPGTYKGKVTYTLSTP